MKKSHLQNAVLVFLALLPFACLAIIWNSVPATVALHFNSSMEPDRMGNKNELWLSTGILAAVSIGVYFLLRNLYRIDPKRAGITPSETFKKLAIGLVLFMTALNFLLIVSSVKGAVVFKNYMFPFLGVMFAFIGNYMNNVKPNYFAGFRLPWTLSDDENWRKTHHLAGKLWFVGGLLIAVAGFIIPLKIMLAAFIAITVIITLVPAIYSYKIFKAKQQAQTPNHLS